MADKRNNWGAILSREVTPRTVFEERRRLIKQLSLGAIGGAGMIDMLSRTAWAQSPTKQRLPAPRNPAYAVDEKQTAYQDATHYNNFYEFGTGKEDPARHAGAMPVRPWTIQLDGEIKKPLTLDMDDLLKLAPLEERIYRLRCVEGWSMVIPWIGYSLAALIAKAQPNGQARYVEFISKADPAFMPGVRGRVLQWPYSEGLRLDEAMHPLTLLGLGMYGEVLPKQNGAPVRVIVPWKYGFKSAKSLVRIRFTRQQPQTAWNKAAAQEYGFYSNVNPQVDHPRWSQATERRIGEDGFFTPKRKTLMFNGYGDQVAYLYQGMDLTRQF